MFLLTYFTRDVMITLIRLKLATTGRPAYNPVAEVMYDSLNFNKKKKKKKKK